MPALILFDDVPGGAGRVQRLVENEERMERYLELPWRGSSYAIVVAMRWIQAVMAACEIIGTSSVMKN